MFVLHVLKEQGALPVGQLAERTATDPSSVSVVIRKLHEKKLVAKKPSAEDGRRQIVSLTAAGERLIRAEPVPYQEVLMGRMAQLAPGDLHALADLLEQVAPQAEEGRPAPMFFTEETRGKS